MLWRGSTTGSRHDRQTLWRPSQRSRLNLRPYRPCHHADPAVTNHHNGSREILYSPTADGAVSTFTAEHAVINKRYFDVAFTGAPVQCEESDGTCAAVKQTYRFDKPMGAATANQYRYVMDVDGNGARIGLPQTSLGFRLVESLLRPRTGWSGRFHRLMSSRSAVLKSTQYVECPSCAWRPR